MMTLMLLVAMSDWNVRDHVPLEQFIVQAHRGAGELAEENTLEAFELGWKLNCIPEADIRMTSDGVIVAFHDKDFSRVVKNVPPELAKKGVKDITFAELQKLDVGSFKGDQFAGRRVSRMSDVFALMTGKRERRMYLDIKEVDLPKLAAEVKGAKVESQVIFASTKYPLIREWRKLVLAGQTLLWMGGTEEALEKRFVELRAANFADITQIQIHTHVKDGKLVESDEFLIDKGNEIRARRLLFQTLPYNGSTKEIYWKLLDLGLMSFATDHPEVTWDAIKSYYARGAK
jgi:glycerophosphoryl diester phosphodiesterase